MILKYVIKKEENGITVRNILKRKLFLSGNNIRSLKNHGSIYLNEENVFTNHLVNVGDTLRVDFAVSEESNNVIPCEMDLKVLYEDDAVIALDKPKNMVVHPISQYPDNTLANGLRHYFDSRNIHTKIRPLGRLDRNTSGIVLFAKNSYVQHRLIMQMRDNTYLKEYTAILCGNIKDSEGIINLPIKRLESSIITRIVHPEGSPSETHYRVIRRFDGYDLVRFILKTGRTHQLRVHAKAIGHPIVGDTLYSDNVFNNMERQALHSSKVGFINPLDNEFLTIESKIPDDMISFLDSIESRD